MATGAVDQAAELLKTRIRELEGELSTATRSVQPHGMDVRDVVALAGRGGRAEPPARPLAREGDGAELVPIRR